MMSMYGYCQEVLEVDEGGMSDEPLWVKSGSVSSSISTGSGDLTVHFSNRRKSSANHPPYNSALLRHEPPATATPLPP